MPDVMLLAKAMGVAIALSAALVWLISIGGTSSRRAMWGSAFSIGVGFALGASVLSSWPRWPPIEDKDRLFLWLLPAVLLAETITAIKPRLGWPFRLVVPTVAIPVLLHGTGYWKETGGSISILAVGTIAISAVFLCLEWMTLDWLATRWPITTSLSLALTSAASGVSIMLSGYMSAGLTGFVLAAAGAGSLIPRINSRNVPQPVSVSVPVVGTFSLLVMGVYFGTLPIGLAACLFAAPLLTWAIEVPILTRVPVLLRSGISAGLVMLPLALTVAVAMDTFVSESAQNAGSVEPTVDDYMNFGK